MGSCCCKKKVYTMEADKIQSKEIATDTLKVNKMEPNEIATRTMIIDKMKTKESTTGTLKVDKMEITEMTIGTLKIDSQQQPSSCPSISIAPADVTSLDQIVQDADFSRIVSRSIKFESNPEMPLSSRKHRQKEAQKSSWQEKYFVHGDLSDIVAYVQSQTNGCNSSSVPDEMNRYIYRLHHIAVEADAILHDRVSKISSLEQEVINRLVQERQDIINKIIKQGGSQMNVVDDYYRKLIEQFIAKLEIEMSKQLDSVQKQVEARKEQVVSDSNKCIKDLAMKSQTAKQECHQQLQSTTESERQKVLRQISDISTKKGRQPLAFEQLKKFNVEIYSTVGTREDGQDCDNIPDRKKFIRDINEAKLNHRSKRTVYIGNSHHSIQAS
ncbi:unnamed protein product [Rotaria socialis]|uniref:Uncharacterized protein n=1 Tax=Rotaria socialis TaxID=392032 RepID=A0A818CXL4_9BILA|nr:unnamed protein product [Rotaria socialis]